MVYTVELKEFSHRLRVASAEQGRVLISDLMKTSLKLRGMYPNLQIPVALICVVIAFVVSPELDGNWSYVIVSGLILLYIFVVTPHYAIVIDNDKIKLGIDYLLFKKTLKDIPLKSIESIRIEQNVSQHFECFLITSKNEKIYLFKNPNKQPLAQKVEKVKNLLNNSNIPIKDKT